MQTRIDQSSIGLPTVDPNAKTICKGSVFELYGCLRNPWTTFNGVHQLTLALDAVLLRESNHPRRDVEFWNVIRIRQNLDCVRRSWVPPGRVLQLLFDLHEFALQDV
jgi:hypothetical protein